MRTLLAVCILLFTRASLAHAQASAPGQAPPAAGVVEGDVYLKMQNGDIRRMAEGRVHPVPDSVVRSLAPVCEAHDSSRNRYVRLRRPIRLAYEAARSAHDDDARAGFLARVSQATAAAMAALEPARRAENEVMARVAAQPSAETSMEAHYTFEGVAPGQYWLYANTGLPYFWFAPVRVAGERVKRDLDHTNVTRVLVDKTYMTAADVCAHAQEVPEPPEAGEHREVEERQPVLANRAETQRALQRRYPAALRGVDGSVTVRFRIAESGSVDPETVEAIAYWGPEAARGETEAAAEMVVEAMRFAPALVDRRPVKSWVTLPIVFHTER